MSLTRADLDNLRQSALGAADPLGVAADLADAVEAGRLADPQDAGYALTLAAEIAESRSKHEAALRYAGRALAQDGDQPGSAKALRARILFRSGRDDEAMTELETLRPLLTEDPDAAAYVSAALAVGKRIEVAEQWLTDAVRSTLAERGASTEPASADDAGLLFFLLQQRHRLRHALGRPHDAHDNLADRLETRLANQAATETAADLLFWPEAEFASLVQQWPALAESYGKSWDEHRAHLEQDLVSRTNPVLLRASVAGLTRFAGSDGDPADPEIRAGYAGRLAGASAQVTWPPERNGSCWCGSGAKYKKCCLPRSRG
ncbi:SEC-C domain-containing protein [Actinoplanes sp. TFC3]|uniref:SEC-C domain-containing protein n=1 Tax=Actinoplanes sp. TFC3 TaxID=1710355 RepID=UPI000834D499|nr:SEC-C domain-containing protein [Actinoplanes sp. TFC3]